MKKSLITFTLLLAFTALHAQKKSIVGIWNFENEVFLEFTEKQLGVYGNAPNKYMDYYIHDDKIIANGQPMQFKLKGNKLTFNESKISGKRFVPSKTNPLKQGIYYADDYADVYFIIQNNNNMIVSDFRGNDTTKYLIDGSKLYLMLSGRAVALEIIDNATFRDRHGYSFKLITPEEFAVRNRYSEIRAAYFQKNYEKAIELAQKAITETPDDIRFYHILADIYQTQKDYKKTIDILNQSLQIEEHNVSAMGNLSFYYLFVKDYAAAEQMARKALALDSTQTWIYTNLASAILFQDRYEEAEKLFLALKDKDCLHSTCAEAWLDDFRQFKKAGVIPENQKENVRKIWRLLDEWVVEMGFLTSEQEKQIVELVGTWFEELMKAEDVNRVMQVSDVPFAFDNERVIITANDLKDAYRDIFANKGQRAVPKYTIEVEEYESRIVWGYPVSSVRVSVKIDTEDDSVKKIVAVTVLVRDNTFTIVGFSD